MPPPRIRLAQTHELPLLSAIEDNADQIYNDMPAFGGLDDCAGIVPAENDALVDSSWPTGSIVHVAESDDSELVGMSFCYPVDKCLYLAQLSVVMDAQRSGIGGMLVHAGLEAALQANMRGVVLCTFSELAWNAPFYRKQGFINIAAHICGPQFTQKATQDEAEWGRFGGRVAMGYFF